MIVTSSVLFFFSRRCLRAHAVASAEEGNARIANLLDFCLFALEWSSTRVLRELLASQARAAFGYDREVNIAVASSVLFCSDGSGHVGGGGQCLRM
ncbi:hypothetical protein B0H11DRAFT_2008619 [Mycena galericulata]|nr:hypothetical protein B0H11DRAFT_2008619 [Mycena galericulata]